MTSADVIDLRDARHDRLIERLDEGIDALTDLLARLTDDQLDELEGIISGKDSGPQD